MAREFSGTNQNVERSSGVVGIDVAQRTIACWVWVDVTGAGQVFYTTASALSSGNSADTFTSNAPAVAGWRFFYQYRWTTTGGWLQNADNALSTWTHVAVTYDRGATTNDPILYVNGTAVGFTETAAPTGTAKTGQVAYRFGESAAGAQDFDGRIDGPGFWDRILPAADIAALAKGFTPSCFPRGLKSYVEFGGRRSPEPDQRQPGGATVNGATYVDGPRLIRPRAR